MFNNETESKAEEETEDTIEYRKPQIIYCSRTHSQLCQFVNEIKKTKFNDDNLEILTIGSRKQLCIHPTISKYKSVARMNDACLNLKDSKTNKKIKNDIAKRKRIKIGCKRSLNEMNNSKDGTGARVDDMMDDLDLNNKNECPYLNDKLSELSLQITTKIHDIEECHHLGKQMGICPYYGIRKAIHSAHLIAMPYTSLIHEKTRKSLGIEIKDNVIIIDEAHNLIENINKIHTVHINLVKLKMSYFQLNQYKEKYINRLKHANVTKIKTILKVITCFAQYLSSNHNQTQTATAEKQSEYDEYVISIDDLLFDLKIDHINFYELIQYIEKSEIVRKLHGFIDKQYLNQIKKQEKTDKQKRSNKTNTNNATKPVVYHNTSSVIQSPLSFVVSIFEAFTNIDCDGKLIVTKYRDANNVHKNSFKYVMLNPSVHFKQILAECRSLILCGGTMQPMDHFIQQLFPPKHTKKQICTLECNHVVSPQRVLALSIPSGPCGKKFDFTFKNRFNHEMIQDLGRAIVNFAKIVRGGIVIFFPSFAYLQYVLKEWKKATSQIFHRLSQRKVIFLCFSENAHFCSLYDVPFFCALCQKVLIEPESSTEVDGVLEAYNEAIYPQNAENKNSSAECNGGVLLCVVGGKMSEGINFKDDLCRAVVMVGLPYPNPNDIELKERMKYLKETIDDAAGNVYYNNLCMRAVNQSIGRAIRHKLDYGSILLMDYRYGERQNVYESIPNWIKKSYMKCSSFQKAYQPFCKFINCMRSNI